MVSTPTVDRYGVVTEVSTAPYFVQGADVGEVSVGRPLVERADDREEALRIEPQEENARVRSRPSQLVDIRAMGASQLLRDKPRENPTIGGVVGVSAVADGSDNEAQE